MNLADYQQELVEQVYALLLVDDLNKGIVLFGDVGSGKSTIARGIADRLQEGWTIFYIEGVDPTLSPYLTWHIGTKLYSKMKLNYGGEITFGVNFLPVPISLEFGGSFQSDKTNFILNSSEEALISSIKKQTGANQNILFIADNYELWDIPSKQFLQKIMLPELRLLAEFHTSIVLISHERVPMENDFLWKNIPVSEISDDNVLFVLRQRGYSSQINIRDIRLCSGNDLSLALMAASYYDESNPSTSNFNEIMEKRCKGLSAQNHEACKILEPLSTLSIIDSYFTKDEMAFFIDSSTKDETETDYQAEEYLALAEEQLFIVGKESYRFTNQKVKAYFKAQLSNREKLHHRKFASYLQKRHAEDYFNRGKHLKFSLQINDNKVILDAWQLLFLAYIRRSFETSGEEDVYNILPDIESLLERLNPELAEAQRHVLKEFKTGYQEFCKYNYKQTLFHLQAITPSRLIPACLAECLRLVLLCYVQLAENPIVIGQTAEELFDTIEAPSFCEDEQYCRAALVLLDVYLDRSSDNQKVKILKRKLTQIIQQHPGYPAFEEFEACYNRKSTLYFTATIACRQTAQSVQFYRNHYNRNGLYMALCNHSGNAIVSGDYTTAEQALTECTEMLGHNGWYYPSRYKVENNRILLTYLQEEELEAGNRKQLLSSAKKAVESLSKIMDYQEDEVSHVIFFNYLGLSILSGSKVWPSKLANANQQLAETDAYYQYFLHDLNLASALLCSDIVKAKYELNILKGLDVPLLRDYSQIFLKRRCVQESFICASKQLNGDPVEYHRAISAACSHVQDSSCHFFGRGFLLSDLQFLSF